MKSLGNNNKHAVIFDSFSRGLKCTSIKLKLHKEGLDTHMLEMSKLCTVEVRPFRWPYEFCDFFRAVR